MQTSTPALSLFALARHAALLLVVATWLVALSHALPLEAVGLLPDCDPDNADCPPPRPRAFLVLRLPPSDSLSPPDPAVMSRSERASPNQSLLKIANRFGKRNTLRMSNRFGRK